mmetsp:Transcript_30806/g.62116  ORF Transcript_30806/g.62116 Transcript_30806/m.62116 type:complete len:99 (-) Transcript_30806:229-525(-)
MVRVAFGTVTVGATGHAKIILWTEFVAEKDEASATSIVQGVIDTFASLAVPCGLVVMYGFGMEVSRVVMVLASGCVILAGQAGLALLVLPAHGKAKEE